jgi:hypothetical protein
MERLSKPCLHAPNCRRPANAFCKNSSCKSCCLKHNGGCDQVRGHRAANFQPRHTLAPGPSLFHSQESQPTSSFSESLTPFGIDRDLTFDSFAESIRQGNPVLRLKEECASQAAAEQQAALHEAQLEAQDDAELEKAIVESLYSLSPSTSPVASNSKSTSALPSSNPQPIPTTTPSTALTMGGLPVTRVTTSNRPTITTQMSKDWMRPYEDKSKQVQESPAKGQIDKEIIEKFRIVWWRTVCRLNLTLIFFIHIEFTTG